MDQAPGHVKIIWVLYLVSIFTGLTSIVGVILAYVWRGDDADHPMASHYAKQIKVFWYSVIGFVVGALLTIVIIGWFIMIAAGLYFAVMSVIGLVKALDDKPWA